MNYFPFRFFLFSFLWIISPEGKEGEREGENNERTQTPKYFDNEYFNNRKHLTCIKFLNILMKFHSVANSFFSVFAFLYSILFYISKIQMILLKNFTYFLHQIFFDFFFVLYVSDVLSFHVWKKKEKFA